MQVKVTLRKKAISDGRLSLYLDFYPAIVNGQGKETRREFLKMYVFKNPTGGEQTAHNKTTYAIANRIRESRSLSIYNEEYGFKKNVQLNINFIAYFDSFIEQKSERISSTSYQSWLATFSYYKKYAKVIYTNSLTKKHIEGFKQYLLQVKSTKTKQKLSSSTVATYFKNFLSVVNTAYEEDILKKDLTKGIKNVKAESKLRAFLTIEELHKLWNTPTKNNALKYICFFCVYTGFRFAEANKLKWEDISKDNSGNYVVNSYHTKGEKYTSNPIPKEAYDLLKTYNPNGKKGKIFDLSYHKTIRNLKLWVEAAGISKNIGMHNFRHTYAVLQIDNGTDIFIVSKMLGHKNIATTMIYAKVTDNKKNETTNKIKLNTNETN